MNDDQRRQKRKARRLRPKPSGEHRDGKKCADPLCTMHRIERLQQRLGADYCSLKEFAAELGGSIRDTLSYLRFECTLHNMTEVEAGREEVGEEPIFLTVEYGCGHVAVELFSIKPENSPPVNLLEPWEPWGVQTREPVC